MPRNDPRAGIFEVSRGDGAVDESLSESHISI
jgi:hypothetical protein